MNDSLVIAGRAFRSRLIVGTGKYRSFAEMQRAHEASGADMVTVAVRRVNLTDRSKESLLDYLDRDKYFLLPNTAGCYTAEEAVRTARLGREVGLSNWVKLEVIGDQQTLFPDTAELVKATEMLVKEGFVVLPYTNDDLVVARRLVDAGAAAVMPLGAPIGSGLGIQNHASLRILRERITEVPSDRGRRRGHGLRCRRGHGVGRRRRADEHRHRRSAGCRAHGLGHAARRRGRPGGVSRRPNSQEALRQRVQPSGRRGSLTSAASSSSRIAYLDWTRGLACLLMFQTHCYDAWLGGPARETAFFHWTRLGGTIPAPIFLFLAGVAVALVADRAMQKGAPPQQIARATMRRGAQIFGLGLLFRLQEFLLGQPRAPWTDLLRVDVLNIIGVSLVLLGALYAGRVSWALGHRAGESELAERLRARLARPGRARSRRPSPWPRRRCGPRYRPRWLPWYSRVVHQRRAHLRPAAAVSVPAVSLGGICVRRLGRRMLPGFAVGSPP